MKKNLAITILCISIILSSISLSAQNNAPVAVNDTIYVEIGQELNISPLQNDYDPDGDQFSLLNGSLFHNSGIVMKVGDDFNIIISNKTFLTLDSIRYIIKDEYGKISSGFIIINIAPSRLRDTLAVNNISAPFASWGTDFYSNDGVTTKTGFRAPKGSKTSTIFTSTLWMAGHDIQDSLHSASRVYDNAESDFTYGPVSNTIGDINAHDSIYNRTWKVSKAQIMNHKLNYYKSSYSMPEAIANWPAHGDVSIGQSPYLASFVDYNADGVYNPLHGDYPEINGDECVLSIMNDNTNRFSFNDIPLKVEIYQMAYAYNCTDDTALNNTIFMHYDVYNRSQNTYSDFIFGNFNNFDIGNPYDDYLGCDSTRNLFYAFNSSNIDGSNEPEYGANPPAQGVRILNYSLSSFNVFNPFTGPAYTHMPLTKDELYNSLDGKFKNGMPIYNQNNGDIGSIITKYFYHGNTVNGLFWSEISAANPGHDVQALGNVGPFNFVPNQKITIDLAMIYSRDINKGAFENVLLLLKHSDHIQDIYDGVATPGCVTIGLEENLKPEIGFSIYPNPTSGYININSNISFHNADYKIYSMLGQLVGSDILKNNTESISVSNLQTGIYLLSIAGGSKTYSQKFVIK